MPRKARIVTTTLANVGPSTPEANRKRGMELLDLACTERPDLVCLPETFVNLGVRFTKAEEVAESVPGPTADQAAARARRHRTYVACPVIRRADDGRMFNSTVLLGRDGSVVGIYDKMHPVASSAHLLRFEHGLHPGERAATFDLDFGRVGVQTCFDLGFPEGWGELEDRGAELVIWPSAFDGGLTLRAYALLHQYYIVSSVLTPHARIIDPVGRVLAETGSTWPLAVAEVDLDFLIVHPDYNRPRIGSLKARYGDGVAVSAFEEEGCFLLTSNLADRPIKTMAAEFGLTAFRNYHRHHLPQYEALRAGRSPQPQEPPLY